MPIRIEANQNTAPNVKVVKEPAGHDNTFGLNLLADGVKQGTAALTNYMDKRNLEEADKQISALTSEGIAAERDYATQLNRLMDKAGNADRAIALQAQDQLTKLRDAHVQGLIGGSELEIRANQLVKFYANAYPHLGTEIRALGANANGNFTAAARATEGKDPQEAARDKIYGEALAVGLTPYEYIQGENKKYLAELDKIRNEDLARTQSMDKDKMYIGLTSEVNSYMVTRLGDMGRELDEMMKSGAQITDNDLLARVEAGRTHDLQYYRNRRDFYQHETGIPLGVTESNNIEANINSLYDGLVKQLGAAKTLEKKKEFAKNFRELTLASSSLEMYNLTGNFGVLLATTSPEAFNALITSGVQSKRIYRRFLERNNNDPAKADEAYTDLFQTDPTAMLMRELDKKGQLDQIIALGVGNIYDKGQPSNTGIPTADNSAQNTAMEIYEGNTYEDRKPATYNMVSGLTYEAMVSSPIILSDIKHNPQAEQAYIDKTNQYMAGLIGERGSSEEMEIDFSNPDRPISYRHRLTGSKDKDIEKLNKAFVTARNTLTRSGFDKFVENLKSQGVQQSSKGLHIRDPMVNNPRVYDDMGPADRGRFNRLPPNKRASAPAPDLTAASQTPNPAYAIDYAKYDYENAPVLEGDITDPQQLVDFAVQKGEQAGVPAWLTKAFAEKESSLGTKLVGIPLPATKNREAGHRATGLLHVIPDTFEGINKQVFGGQLEFGRQTDKALAGVALLAQLYKKYGDNVDRIAGEYFGGPDWHNDKGDGLSSTRQYIADISRLVEKYRTEG